MHNLTSHNEIATEILKCCSSCGHEQPLDYFYKDKRGRHGRRANCKACQKLATASNPNAAAASLKYRQAHRQTIRRRSIEHYRQRKLMPFSGETAECFSCGKAHPLEEFTMDGRGSRTRSHQCRFCSDSEKRQRWADHNPAKRRAHWSVKRAVRRGFLPKITSQPCQICKSQAAEYHHHRGYTLAHQLDVIPLCLPCHAKAHRC